MLTALFLLTPLPPAYLERRGLACELLIVLKSRPDASCSITSPDRPPTAAPVACHFSTSADARDVEGAISHPAVVLRAGARLLLLIGRAAISLRLRPARGFGSRLIGIFLDVCARRRRGNLVGGIRALRETVVPRLKTGDAFESGEPNSLHSSSRLGGGQQHRYGARQLSR